MPSRHHSPSQDQLFFNGVDAATGGYAFAPTTAGALAEELRRGLGPEQIAELRREAAGVSRGLAGGSELRDGVDSRKLFQTGWGLVLPAGAQAGPLLEALSPLLDWRRRQATARFRIFSGADGVRPGETLPQFLARHAASPDLVDPLRLPYYLLLVGSPAEIPFDFQLRLDARHAVGRISFDHIDHYARYAESVVAAEKRDSGRSPLALFFSPQHPDDPASRLALGQLAQPLAEYLQRRHGGELRIRTLFRERAVKDSLLALLAGERPALLFAAAHGMEFPPDAARREAYQGALLDAGWPLPAGDPERVPRDAYLAAGDLGDDQGDVKGLIAFLLASHSAGSEREGERPAFLAALPQRLLGHRRGGALAVVGQVGRVRGHSFAWTGAAAGEQAYEKVLRRLLAGEPLGAALQPLAERQGELAARLADRLEDMAGGELPDPHELAGLFTAHQDARGLVLLGDPAVRFAAPLGGTRSAPPPPLPMSPPEGRIDRGGPSRGSGDGDELLGGAAEEAKPTRGSGSLPRGKGDRALPVEPDPAGGWRSGALAEPPAAEPPAAESPAAEPLRFSAYHPTVLEVGVPRRLLVYAHLPAAMGLVEDDAVSRLGREARKFRRQEAAHQALVAPGTEIVLEPQAKGLSFDPPTRTLTWQAPLQHAEFAVTADASRLRQVSQGSVAVYVGPLMVAEIPLAITVVEKGHPSLRGSEPKAASVSTFGAIFASYSHHDKALVEAMETAAKAMGMKYLRDVTTLRIGEQWSPQLLEMIESADRFQLFWSNASRRSAFVEQEWRHAWLVRENKGADFILPLYWEDPMPEAPEPLSELHFGMLPVGTLGPLR